MVRFTTFDDEIREQKLPCKILYMGVGVQGDWEGGSHVKYLWYYSKLKYNHQFEGDRWQFDRGANIYESEKFISRMPKTRAVLQLVSTPLPYLFD